MALLEQLQSIIQLRISGGTFFRRLIIDPRVPGGFLPSHRSFLHWGLGRSRGACNLPEEINRRGDTKSLNFNKYDIFHPPPSPPHTSSPAPHR